MQHGLVKVCAATVPIKVADVCYNTNNIIKAFNESVKKGSALTVFPELSVCGYTCGDLFNQSALLKSVHSGLENLRKATAGVNTLLIAGAPLENCGRLYNCAVVLCNGDFLGVVPKTYLPNYGEFYEKRHFTSAPETLGKIKVADKVVPFGTDIIFKAENCENFTVAVEICEDLWAPLSPSVKSTQNGANIIVNLSCSDETVGKAEYRRNLIKMQSAKLISGYIYCDAGDGESTTDLVFSGHNIIGENGVILNESALFENGLVFADLDLELIVNERRRLSSVYYSGKESDFNFISFTAFDGDVKLDRKFLQTPFVPVKESSERSELILTIQSKGLEKRLMHTNSQTAVIGLSGGLDSALALLVTCRAFKLLKKDFKDIIAVTMPCFGTTERTKNNSLKLIKALGVTGLTVPVTDSVINHFKDIGQDANCHDSTYENAQARMRTLVLMDIANKENGIVVGTGDLSELALGWATYNGDHMSMYGVNCSVPKTLVKHLVNYEAEKLGGEALDVLNDILNTEISPELLPPDENGGIAQKTEEVIGPYELHDFFLYYGIRYGFSPLKVAYLAENAFEGVYDKATVIKWLKKFYSRFFSQQFKRSCVPDGVKIGSVSLSPRGDWRMPSDAEANIWLKELQSL